MPGKRVLLTMPPWTRLRLASRTGKSFQELTDQAFADLLASTSSRWGSKVVLGQSVDSDRGKRLSLFILY
jgi:hypothetical protein